MLDADDPQHGRAVKTLAELLDEESRLITHSFEIMRRLRLRRAFAFDRHFAEQGFELVPA